MKRNAYNSDISGILDPSYSPARSNQPLSVYVDRHGNIHDPDYRQFPTISNIDTSPRDPTDDDEGATPIDNDFYSHLTNAYNRAGNAYAKNKRNSQYSQYSHIYASYRSPYHYFSTSAPTPSSYSPPTSYDSDQTVFDDGVEDSSIHEDSGHSQYNILKRKLGKRRGSGSSNGSGSQSPVSKTRQEKEKEKEKEKRMSGGSETPSPSSAPAAVVGDESFQFHYPHLHQPQPLHNQPHHPHHHHSHHHHHHHHRASPPHRHLSPHNELDEQYLFSSSPVDGDHETGLGLDIEKPKSPHRQQTQEQHEWTPTCTQSLRREWQALSLRFRFSVYRAKRRIKRRMESLI